tara:strand:- start:171 stop:377 length:207 start_codon:yes stop_codon:yes gene_type:complete
MKLLISFGAPLLISLAILGLVQREGREKIQILPALFVGSGLIMTSAIRLKRRRKMLFFEIRNSQQEKI